MGNSRKKTSGTKEWADFNVNCVKGCANDCRYCYAKMIAKRFGRCSEDTWKDMEINRKAVEKKYGKYQGRVMFPSSHDIVNIPKIKNACYTVLQKLLDSENEVLITIKPDLTITKEIVTQFQTYKPLMQFRFTITSQNNETLSFWERNAPQFEERLESLILAHSEGYKTSVSIEPFLDYEPQKLVRKVAPYVTESIWLGPMNYIPRNNISDEEKPIYEQMRKNTEVSHLKEIYEELKNYPKIRFKDSMKNKMGLS